MSVRDEQCREIAKKLRGIESCEMDGEELCDCAEVECALGLVSDDGAWYQADGVRKLAELIDVPTSEGVVENDGTSVCGHCGFRFHVSVEVSGCFSEIVLANHCPQCGRLLVWREEVDE